MSFWFESKGYSVIVASNGLEAIEKIKNQNPDIVFLDLNMPVMDGVETLKKVRAFNKELPIIVVSAYLDTTRVKEAYNYGISGVFYKGADFKEGLALLETALRTHKKLQK
jgi:two-component system response regulator (stage 0 sporulation protein F)